MSKRLKISFDYDSTLSEEWIQEICKYLQKAGHEIFITTSRCPDDSLMPHMNKDWNKDLYLTIKQLNIPKENVTFTQYIDKYEILDKNGMDIHIDDDEVEIELLEENKSICKGVLVTHNLEYDIKQIIKKT